MAAPQKNEFWKLRSKHGRDKTFETPELLLESAIEYFQWCCDNPIKAQDNKGTKNVNEVSFMRPFTIKGLCIFCDINEHWFSNFEKTANDDFNYVIRKIKDIIYTQKLEGAIIGIYNHNIIARDLGLSDKTEVKGSQTITLENISLEQAKELKSKLETDV